MLTDAGILGKKPSMVFVPFEQHKIACLKVLRSIAAVALLLRGQGKHSGAQARADDGMGGRMPKVV